MSYESAINTQMLASNCCFCGKPLNDPESVQRGCGPDCAAKYGRPDMHGAPDASMLEQVFRTAPKKFTDYVSKAASPWEVARKAIWQAAMAVSYGGPEAGAIIAAAVNAATASGYHVVARQIAYHNTPHSDKAPVLELIGEGRKEVKIRRGLSIEQSGSSILVFTPYNDSLNLALKKLGGRFDAPSKGWRLPSSRTLEVVNLFVEFFPGSAFMGPTGVMIPVPAQAVPVPPPAGAASGAPTKETGDAPADRPSKLEDVRKGDVLVAPDGRQLEVGWVGMGRDGTPRLGFRQPGTRDFLFVSFADVKYVPASEGQRRSREAQPSVAPEPAALHRPVPDVMFPYQIEGVRWLDQHGSGILADDMGLGKTMQSAVAADPPVIVVCPATLRTNWAREFARWRPDLTTTIISGRTPLPASGYAADVIIVNYDVVDAHLQALSAIRATTLIADEAHYVKTLKFKHGQYEGSSRAAAVATLAKSTRRRFLLTGTPILNRTQELWPLLHIVDPRRWDNFFKFGVQYCAGFQRDVGRKTVWDFSGSSNVEELHQILRERYMLRRLKTDVLEQLPQKSRRTIVVGMDPAVAKQYEKAAAQFLQWVTQHGGWDAVRRAQRAEALAKATALRGLSAAGKIPAAVEWALEFLQSGRQLVVMGHHQNVLQAIVAGLREQGISVVHIFGSDNAAARTAAIDEFQSGRAQVFVGSIMAAGVGITLTAASDMLIVERVWRPGDLVQAEDRIHRIGQKRGVIITYMDCENSIDVQMSNLLAAKTKTAAGVIDGDDLSEAEASAVVFGEMFATAGSTMRANAARGAHPSMPEHTEWAHPLLF